MGVESHIESTEGAARKPAKPPASPSRPRKALTIGAVCKILGQEFEDISISKIRYLEDQKLLSPQRTSGGYRLYSQTDVERLRTILRLQRDEFLPLRVIRRELAAGAHLSGSEEEEAEGPSGGSARRIVSVTGTTGRVSGTELVTETGVSEEFVVELEAFGLVESERANGRTSFDETDVEIVRAAAELAQFGVAGRNLRIFRSSTDREVALLEQLVGPALRSRNPERRQEAVENLENLAAICTHLKHLLLVRRLRKLTG